jgi:hypothetical protein
MALWLTIAIKPIRVQAVLENHLNFQPYKEKLQRLDPEHKRSGLFRLITISG